MSESKSTVVMHNVVSVDGYIAEGRAPGCPR